MDVARVWKVQARLRLAPKRTHRKCPRWTAVWMGWRVGKAQGMGGAREEGVEGARADLARARGPNREHRAAGDWYIMILK